MVINKKKKICLVLAILLLAWLSSASILSNKVAAENLYPTIITANETGTSIDLSDALQKFVNFVKDGIKENTAKNKYTFNVQKDTQKILNNKDSFVDISDHLDKYYINYISQKNIISSNQEKFNPDNFIRLHELSKILVNSYRFKVWYNLKWNIWLTNQNYFQNLMPKYYNTAYEMWLLDNIQNLEDFERFISYQEFYTILSNFQSQYPEMIHIEYMDLENTYNTLKRWEVVRNIVKIMTLDQDTEDLNYKDTLYHQYGWAVERLANLWITNTEHDKFNPDNLITRGDFITMLVKTYLESNDLDFSISALDLDVVDLNPDSVYTPYIVYADENEFIDYLIESRRWNRYIKVNNTMTKHEAYSIISQVAWVQMEYSTNQADQQNITRWEAAQLMIDSFNFGYNKTDWNSQIEKFINNVKFITETKKLAKLF